MRIESKTAAAAASAVMLAGMGLTPLAAMAAPVESAQGDGQAVVSSAEASVRENGAKPDRALGSFSYTQDALTPVNAISDVFAKSAAVLCQSLPAYGAESSVTAIVLTAPDAPAVQGTVERLGGASAYGAVTMGCACATNGAGGGAIANARVQGVLLKSLAAMMGA